MTQVDFYDKGQVDDLMETKAAASDVTALQTSVGTAADEASASGSLWARIKYVLAHWLTSDSEQTITAKKTFSVSPDVPTTPAGTGSAVNSGYVNDATDGVNNIAHKSGEETIPGKKHFTGIVDIISPGARNEFIMKTTGLDITQTYAFDYATNRIAFVDANNQVIGQIEFSFNRNKTSSIKAYVLNSDGTLKSVTLASGDVI